MQQHTLKPAFGSIKKRKRVGRGNGSGHGTYSCRGNKGQGQRSGGNVRPGFAGGQTPLSRKMPKLKGFKQPNAVKFQPVNLEKLNMFDDHTEITVQLLHDKGLIANSRHPVKILGTGNLDKKINLKNLSHFSKSAGAKILAAGGQIKEKMTQ